MTLELDGTERARLIEIVKERSFSTGTQMKLASGRTSSYYFNMKPTMLHPEGARLIGSLVLDRLAGKDIQMIGGLQMGAVPVAAAVAAVSSVAGQPIPAFIVRKHSKEHGTQALIEGLAAGESMAGMRLCVVEDVTTTGGSAMKAVEVLKSAGAEIAMVLTIVDRKEGAGDTFKAAGVPFDALLTVDDFN